LNGGHPLALWTIKSSVTGLLSHPLDALSFLSKPIQKEFSDQNVDIVSTFQHLSILASRYEHKVVHASDVDWRNPFSTSFSFFESTHQCSPKELAMSITDDVATLFSRISVDDVLRRTPRMSSIGAHWSTLSDEVTACTITMRGVEFFLLLAEVY
jgi:hypothetical protein